MFEIFHGKRLTKEDRIPGKIPFLTAGEKNQGVACYIGNKWEKHKNPISIDMFGNSFFHKGIFSGDDNIYFFVTDKITDNSKLFIVNSINAKTKNKYSYGKQFRQNNADTLTIQLPITSTGKIDFAFMENFISELEEERISELSAYLEVTGLKDYTLTPEEENALKDFEKMEWGEFEIGDLFDFLTSKKRFDANKVKIFENGNFPYIVRTSLNNGTKGYLNENEEYLNSGNTISFGQDTATIFYQKEPYFTGDKIKIVKAKDDLFNAKNALYFLTSMNKSFQVYSWGSSSFNVDILSKEKMFLPLQNNSPNYTFMETFIKAVKKLVIKDVVLYADKKSTQQKT